MSTVLLIVHLFVTLALIGVVLIQRSEGGGLGIGSSQGMGSFMSGRGTANLLTRMTAILATIFMLLALTLALLNRGVAAGGRSMLDIPAAPAPATAPASSSNTQAGPAGSPSSKEPSVPGSQTPGAKAPPSPAQPATPAPSTAPGSAAAPSPNKPAAPAASTNSQPQPAEPALPGAAVPGTNTPTPPSGAPAVPTN